MILNIAIKLKIILPRYIYMIFMTMKMSNLE
jgi:hypothetical protein